MFYEIVPGLLYQGGSQSPGTTLADGGFALLVLCAEEHQPPDNYFPGLKILRFPIRDSEQFSINTALKLATTVALYMSNRQKVLVSCAQGHNRSGLITALALREFKKISGELAVSIVQGRVPNSLRNSHFVAAIKKLGTPSKL